MQKSVLLLFLFVTITYSAMGTAFAAEIRRDVIVFDFVSANTDSAGEVFAANLREALKNTGKYLILDTSMVKKALIQQQYFPGQQLTQETALKVGEVMVADEIVLGSVALNPDGTHAVKVLFINVKNGRPIYGKKLMSGAQGGFMDMATEIAALRTAPYDQTRVTQSLQPPQSTTLQKQDSVSESRTPDIG